MQRSTQISTKLSTKCRILSLYKKLQLLEWEVTNPKSCKYWSGRKQFVRVDNTRSETFDVTSGVPQGSLLGPLLFCIFINDLPDVLVFSDPFIFADDLKILPVEKTFWQVQNDLNGIEQWVNENKMKLAMDKCAKLSIRGQTQNYELTIYVSHDLTWKTHRRTTEKSEQSALPTSTKHSSSSKTRDQARTLQVTNFASTLIWLCMHKSEPR